MKVSKLLVYLLVIMCIFSFFIKNGQAQNENEGDPIGEAYKGIQAYSNGANTGKATGYYQCTEYVMRFYQEICGVTIKGKGWGNASGFFSGANSDNNFAAYPNDDGSTPPEPDQILCYGGGTGGYGHVAIITNVDIPGRKIKIIDQNRDRSNPYLEISMTISNGNYSISNQGLGGSYYVQGWVGLIKTGFFSDGWHADISPRFSGCYLSHGGKPVVGIPINRGKGMYVHYWPETGSDKFYVQDFQRADGRYWMLAYNKHEEINSVFAVHDAILDYYLSNWGWRDYGPPMSNEIITTYYGTYQDGQYKDRGDRITIQKFCKLSDLSRKVIGWDALRGTRRCHAGVYSYSDYPGATIYEWKNGQEEK